MTRLDWVVYAALPACIVFCLVPVSSGAPENPGVVQSTVGQWGMYEIALQGPATGNPFVDVTLSAHFACGASVVDANGFYDGDGIYRIRFMPMTQGEWSYRTASNVPELAGKTGHFDRA